MVRKKTKNVLMFLFFALQISKPAWAASSSKISSFGKQQSSTNQSTLPDIISIASFNVENFWDGNPNNTPSGNQESFSKIHFNESHQNLFGKSKGSTLLYDEFKQSTSNYYDPKILQKKVQHLLKTLELAGWPTIVAMQEFESALNQSECFKMPANDTQTFQDVLKTKGYQVFLMGEQEANNPVSVTTALISKIPGVAIDRVIISSGDPDNTSARDIQVVEFNLAGERLLIFNGHWKSKRNGGNEEDRIEIANTINKRVSAELKKSPKTHVIILGDLNTKYTEEPMNTLGAIPNENQRLDSLGYLNLWYDVPVDDRWEHSFNGERTTLSGILISKSLEGSSGFHYLNSSFRVIGQHGPAANILLSQDGTPYRWQVSSQFRKENGDTKFHPYFFHAGEGYSDHLPLVADFSVNKSQTSPAQNKSFDRHINYEDHLVLDQVNKCSEAESVNLLELRINQSNVDDFVGKCVFMEASQPLQFITHGKYKNDFVDITQVYNRHIRVTMTRSFDWRPNLDDTRVSRDEVYNMSEGDYNSHNPHPQSNQCYDRNVLSGPGGALASVRGRLGFKDGEFSIFVASREDLELTDLPDSKQQNCPW